MSKIQTTSPEMVERINEEIWHLQRQFESLGNVNNVTAEKLMRPAFERVALSEVQNAVRECIAVVEHFANDELTPAEWPKYGLVKRAARFDSGYVAQTAEKIAVALRQKFGVGE